MHGAILLVGCGKMGSALVEGWIKRGLNPVDIIIVEPGGREAISCCAAHPALPVLAKAADIPTDFRPDVVVFAVKPQVVPDVVPQYARFTKDGPVFLSIIAGQTIAKFKGRLGEAAAIVRAMPNTPAAIGKGISVMTAAPEVSPVQRSICEKLMTAAGDIVWVSDESLMDAVTAVSGSGPAYVFLLAETLAAAGRAAGLPADLAERLARATVAGSGALLEQTADAPAVLRRNVTSPAGTTAAALGVLMAEQSGLQRLMNDAVDAAARRSRELSN